MRLSKTRKEIVDAVMKDSICQAAGSVLQQHGIGGMTMDRVATTAGLAAGSLYNYFRNKEDLLRCIYERLVEPFFRMTEEIAKSAQPAPQKLERIVRSGLERSGQERGLIRLLVDSGEARQARTRALQIFTDVFAQGICEGSLPPHIPAHAGRMFNGCFAGLFDLQIEGAASADVQQYAETLIAAAKSAFLVQSLADRAAKSPLSQREGGRG